MFGQFLNILGIPQPPTTATGHRQQNNTEEETARRREQILSLSAFLGTAKIKRSTATRVVESVRQVSEVTIWSDRRCPELLSLIIEQQLPRALHRLLMAEPKTAESSAVSVQVLQTLSIMLDGVADVEFLYALFSNNFVNQLIAAPVDLDNEEVLPYYVAFLKALSLKLTPDTMHFFFNERMDDFPLYTTAIGLFEHPDSMVRVAVRAITLNVFRINDRDALEFILNAPQCAHFWEQIMQAIKGACDDAFRILVDLPDSAAAPAAAAAAGNGGHASKEWASVDLILENHMGLLAYLNDIYGLGVERINRRISIEFSERILARTYVHAIEVGWRAGASPEETLFMQVVTLCISHFFAIIRYSPLLIDAVNALFVYSGSAARQPQEQEQDNPALDVDRMLVSDAYASDDPHQLAPAPRSLNDMEIAGGSTTRLTHPFVLSPFETSRTLTPWLCTALELLSNKAISPTTLARSVLTPRRMLRTRALLESLTGSPPGVADCRSFSSNTSALTLSHQSLAHVGTSASNGGQAAAAPSTGVAQLPPYTQAIAASMVQVLADSPASHNWMTIDLAALLLVQLTRSSRGGIVLEPGLSDELENAYAAHSSELRALLLSSRKEAEQGENAGEPLIPRGSWKILVQSLIDFANSSADTLRSKAESEGRLIFSCLPFSFSAEASEDAGSRQSSPFENHTPRDTVFASTIHQAYHLRRLCSSARGPTQRGLYTPALKKWLGSPAPPEDIEPACAATVVDNSAKHMLPKAMTKLGFTADIHFDQGCLYIVRKQENANPVVELVWPLADVLVSEQQEDTPSGPLHILRIRDSVFPQLFYPPRPQSLGGINVVSTGPNRSRILSIGKPNSLPLQSPSIARKLGFAYFGSQKALDISLRFVDSSVAQNTKMKLDAHAAVSQSRLASILVDHNVV
ncbi:Protein CL16A [Coemansia sp. IMI 203386]|nr:Protein CL16A [Coemansia sp. IMI 203386]